MLCWGLTHGPPLCDQPLPVVRLIFKPSRSASWTVCRMSSHHCGLEELHRALDAFSDATAPHPQGTAQTDPLHRLEVRGDPFLGDIPVQPEPIYPGPCRVRRMAESCIEINPRCWHSRTGKDDPGQAPAQSEPTDPHKKLHLERSAHGGELLVHRIGRDSVPAFAGCRASATKGGCITSKPRVKH